MKKLPTVLCRGLLLSLTLLVAVACGAAVEEQEPSPASGDDDGQEEPPPGIVGAIQLVEMRMPAMQMGMTSASARFLYFDPAWLDGDDDAAEEEPCRLFLEDTTAPADPADEELPPKPRDVGAISVQGGLVDVFLEFRGAQYDAAMPEGVLDLFEGGETLLALGAGNDDTGAGEFEVEVVAPADLVVTSPADPSSLTAAEDLVVAWVPGTSESEIQIYVQSRSDDGVRTGALVCEADDASGSFTISADLLAQLPTGDARLEVDRVARGFRRDGPVATNLYAISASIWGATLSP